MDKLGTELSLESLLGSWHWYIWSDLWLWKDALLVLHLPSSPLAQAVQQTAIPQHKSQFLKAEIKCTIYTFTDVWMVLCHLDGFMPWNEFIPGGAELSFIQLQARLWSVGLGEYSAEITFLKELWALISLWVLCDIRRRCWVGHCVPRDGCLSRCNALQDGGCSPQR